LTGTEIKARTKTQELIYKVINGEKLSEEEQKTLDELRQNQTQVNIMEYISQQKEIEPQNPFGFVQTIRYVNYFNQTTKLPIYNEKIDLSPLFSKFQISHLDHRNLAFVQRAIKSKEQTQLQISPFTFANAIFLWKLDPKTSLNSIFNPESYNPRIEDFPTQEKVQNLNKYLKPPSEVDVFLLLILLLLFSLFGLLKFLKRERDLKTHRD